MSNTDPPRKCAKPWCRQIAGPGHHTCDDCRVRDRENQQKSWAKRHKKKALTAAAASDPSTKVRRRGDHDTGLVRDPKHQRTHEVPQDHGETEDEDNFEPVDVLDFDEPDEDAAVNYLDAEDLFDDLQAQMKALAHVDFLGTYALDADPGHESPKERVLMVAKEIWQTLGFHWTVKDHKKQKTGHRTRYWCSQDIARKKKSKPSQAPGAKHCDYIEMTRYPCQSRLSIVYWIKKTGQTYIIIDLHHHFQHTHYIDVTMPLEAIEIIEAQVEWATPSALLSSIREAYPQISSAQVYNAWKAHSETHWQHHNLQIPSTTKLLEEFADEADIFTDLYIPDGVEMLAFGLKKVAEQLKGKVIKVGIDATSIEIGKRKKALASWTRHVRDKYSIKPIFVHTDKDLGEIAAAKETWNAKISLCYWHLRHARVQEEFDFIDPEFRPLGTRVDIDDYEGGVPDDVELPATENPASPPNVEEANPTLGNPREVGEWRAFGEITNCLRIKLPPPTQPVPMHRISDDRSNQENQHHSNIPSTQLPEIRGQGFILRLLDPHESSQAHSPKENTERKMNLEWEKLGHDEPSVCLIIVKEYLTIWNVTTVPTCRSQAIRRLMQWQLGDGPYSRYMDFVRRITSQRYGLTFGRTGTGGGDGNCGHALHMKRYQS
ncbi:hypothetical protein CPB84DRAFT_1963103 [Gymnopilus junonius]|uniref:Transposase n=1 Tax=Gymnopilus junonius TaxID=109634 RepID=A0A9P5NKW0_GYMJU|nr:hypothetical protein CPB84DRAFT_1963103 [Gymnopilus junonius]